jgi:hypothetical protein
MARFTCDMCGAEFGSDEKLADHYKRHMEVTISTPSS